MHEEIQEESLTLTEEDLPQEPRENLLAQVAITIFLGIPMTIALGIALAVYFTYEFIKMRITGRPPLPPQTNTDQESDESTFTTALTKFADVHGPVRRVDVQSNHCSGSCHQRES